MTFRPSSNGIPKLEPQLQWDGELQDWDIVDTFLTKTEKLCEDLENVRIAYRYYYSPLPTISTN